MSGNCAVCSQSRLVAHAASRSLGHVPQKGQAKQPKRSSLQRNAPLIPIFTTCFSPAATARSRCGQLGSVRNKLSAAAPAVMGNLGCHARHTVYKLSHLRRSPLAPRCRSSWRGREARTDESWKET